MKKRIWEAEDNMAFYKFMREKNADFFDKEKHISLDEKNLKLELVRKLQEKVAMFDVVFDKQARAVYLKQKNKQISEDISEFEIQQKIGLRVLVDYFDLVYSLAKIQNINKEKLFNYNELNSVKTLKTRVLKVTNLLIKTSVSEDLLIELFGFIMSLANYLKFNIDDIEKELEKVNNKEGSFLNGKLIKINDFIAKDKDIKC